jgi:uncharacterized integral membrane protein
MLLTLFVVVLLAVLAAIVISRNLKVAVLVLFWGGLAVTTFADPPLGVCLLGAYVVVGLVVRLARR